MDSSATPGSQLGPLNPGNVVSAAIKLYRDRFKTFFMLALMATLWIVGGVVALDFLRSESWPEFLSPLAGDIMAIFGGIIGFLIGMVALGL